MIKTLNRMKHILLVIIFIPLVILSLNHFITPSRIFAAHSRVDLLTADDFAVLAGSAISDTGTTTVTGNVGLSPATGTAITGITCDEVTGTIYDTNGGYAGGGGGSTACLMTNGGLLTIAKNDLATAYDDAAGRPTTLQVATELGGTTLPDGTYDSATGTFGLTGTVTLDGQGDPGAVFIFKMATSLTTASSSRVVLINGAQACNVYWQVGSSATFGTFSTFVGNVLALTSITDNGGSTVNGRVLARNGTVTLNNTSVTKQTCTTPTPASSAGSNSSVGSTSTHGSKDSPNLNNNTPIIIESKRIDSDSVFINWGPYAGIDAFNVEYGMENGKWLYNTNITGFSAILHNLPLNQPVWVRIAERNDSAIGNYGESKFVGGPMLPNTGRLQYANPSLWNLLEYNFLGIVLHQISTLFGNKVALQT